MCSFFVRGEVAVYDLSLFITHDDEVFEMFLAITIHAGSEKQRSLVAEFVLRANSSFVVGAFDFNMDDVLLTSPVRAGNVPMYN